MNNINNLNMEKENLIELIKEILKKVDLFKIQSIDNDIGEEVSRLHEEVYNALITLNKILISKDLRINYLNVLVSIVNSLGHFYLNQDYSHIEKKIDLINIRLGKLKFTLDFFEKINFFNSNIVAVGANGCGKTTLAEGLKVYLGAENRIIISAQRILIIPTFTSVFNNTITSKDLKENQLDNKNTKVTYTDEQYVSKLHMAINPLGNEFKLLIANMLSERYQMINELFNSISKNDSELKLPLPLSNLDIAMLVWNSIIINKTMDCKDGQNIMITDDKSNSYPAYHMSDGEKVILYLAAQVLQAPSSGFIIVDEPEMFLHKSVLAKLWDILEEKRQDCIFIYLTHDIDFAVSRTNAKKVWIKSFQYPDKWEIENVVDNELPESLLLELLGSRKNILFCEGVKGSIDEKIYNLLFPNFTISPVGSCSSVISYTKAFNKIPNSTMKGFGIVDSDFHEKSNLESLKEENIYSISLSEPENLLLDKDFLLILSNKILSKENCVDVIKNNIIEKFEEDLELQISNYITNKINHYFRKKHVSKGNSISEVKENYSNFTEEIEIDKWYDQKKNELKEIIKNKDYEKIISTYNNKGLKQIASQCLGIKDFCDRAINLLLKDESSREKLRKYFPEEIKKAT